jgi:hypothetical protein
LKNSDLLERVPKCFLLSAGVYMILQLIGCSLLFERNDKQTVMDNEHANEENDENESLTKRFNEQINSLGVW